MIRVILLRCESRGTRYSERMPLGTPEEIKSMTAEKLENFYRKWYVPELATIVVVGDLNVGEMEEKIKELFEGIPAVKQPGTRNILWGTKRRWLTRKCRIR